MKKILLLGGTRFIGRILVEELLQTDHQLTFYNRQSTNPDLFPEVRRIKGDREKEEYDAIAAEDWDVVIDLSAYFPLSLEKLLQRLNGKVGRYVFLSTISVYDFAQSNGQLIGEEFPVVECTPEQMRDVEMKSYGARKAECERVLLRAEIEKIILRPSLVYGRYDYTDRFYYWLHQVKTQEKITLPEGGKELNTLTCADDLARLLMEAMDVKPDAFPVYNAATNTPRSLLETINIMCAVLGRKPGIASADGKKLIEQGIKPGFDIPLWHTIDVKIDNSKLRRDFKTELRSYEKSIADVAYYYESLGWAAPVLGRR